MVEAEKDYGERTKEEKVSTWTDIALVKVLLNLCIYLHRLK